MAKLNQEALQFFIQARACSIPVEEVTQALKLHFTTEISEEELRLYDPTRDPSPDYIGPFHIRLFAATRATYEAGLESWSDECSTGSGTKEHRLALLQHTFDGIRDWNDLAGLSPRDSWLMLQFLEEARKSSNHWYEQSGDVQAGDAQMIRLTTLGRDVNELLKDYEGGPESDDNPEGN